MKLQTLTGGLINKSLEGESRRNVVEVDVGASSEKITKRVVVIGNVEDEVSTIRTDRRVRNQAPRGKFTQVVSCELEGCICLMSGNLGQPEALTCSLNNLFVLTRE